MDIQKEKNKFERFTQKIGTKPLIILAMILLFLIPISLIKSLINDRIHYQRDAVRSILTPKGGEPNLEGILFAVPYTKVEESYDKDGKKNYKEKTFYIISTPEVLDISAIVNPEYLNRGIFEVPIFSCQLAIKGNFIPLDYTHTKIADSQIQWQNALLLIGVQNKKTLLKTPEIYINGNTHEKLKLSLIEPPQVSPFTNTIYYSIPEKYVHNQFNMDIKMDIQGGNTLNITPIARNTNINIESSWVSPSFSGGWLPTSRTITQDGFNATWNIAGLSTIYPQMWITEQSEEILTKKSEQIQIGFKTPVDNYKKNERSIKYALLFLLIPFITIFIFEIFTSIRIHPVQYCLVGLADVIFYLLLLSISEHLSFSLTYWITSGAVSLLMMFYAATIFKKFKWGLAFAVTQFISYVFLFGTLQAEDFALLIGSLGLFFVLGLLMILTRKIDWYENF